VLTGFGILNLSDQNLDTLKCEKNMKGLRLQTNEEVPPENQTAVDDEEPKSCCQKLSDYLGWLPELWKIELTEVR
jgi:hypothetical protein